MLKAIGFDRNECFITNVLPWRPPGNRTPTEGEIAVCLPFLKRQIDLVSPEAIMILGGSAANALLDNGEPISRMRGKWLEYKKSDGGKVPVLASFHPAYLLRNSGQKAKAWVDMLRMKQNCATIRRVLSFCSLFLGMLKESIILIAIKFLTVEESDNG